PLSENKSFKSDGRGCPLLDHRIRRERERDAQCRNDCHTCATAHRLGNVEPHARNTPVIRRTHINIRPQRIVFCAITVVTSPLHSPSQNRLATGRLVGKLEVMSTAPRTAHTVEWASLGEEPRQRINCCGYMNRAEAKVLSTDH